MKLFKQIYKYIILGIVLIILGCYVITKIHNINYFDIKNIRVYDNYVDGLIENEVYKLKSEKLDDSEYLKFKDLKIKNDFSNFKKSSDSNDMSLKYNLYDKENNIEAAFSIYIGEMYLDLYKKDVVVFKSLDAIYEDTDRVKYFKKKNIENDIDLFKYVLKTKDKKATIFSSTEDIKNNYAIHFLVSGIYSNVDSITFIEGDYEGYIFNYDSVNQHMKEINIIKNDKRYSITLTGNDYFTEEYVSNLLNTIVIE